MTCVIVDLLKGDNFSSSVSLSEWVLQMKPHNILRNEMWRTEMSKALFFKALAGYQSMQVDICNWQFFSGFIAIHYWDAEQSQGTVYIFHSRTFFWQDLQTRLTVDSHSLYIKGVPHSEPTIKEQVPFCQALAFIIAYFDINFSHFT